MQAEETSSAPATEQLPPFPPHLFPLILQYLLPPTPPIPSHLLSNSLLQRHYFLDINPSDDPDLYFLFPTPGKNSSDVIRELERMASGGNIPPNGDEPSVEYIAQEGSAVRARVPLGEKLLVIFSLDTRDPNAQVPPATETVEEVRPEWRYHDVIWKSDDLPPGHPDVQAALTAVQQSSKTAESASEETDRNEDEEDDSPEAQQKRAEAFWSGWSSPSSLDNSPAVERKPLSSEDAEAAYFARYGEVIPVIPDSSLASTSASSTRPSTAADSLTGSRVLGMLDSSQIPIIPTEGHNTPTTLSSRKLSLKAIQPPSAVLEGEIGKTPTIPRRSPLLGDSAILVPREDANAEGPDMLEAGVADVIRGAWKLWNASRPPAAQESLAHRKEAFVRLIEQTVASLS
ncbi:hypothetical protein FRC01_002046 [Tulasnella sp. 417]|nr:hypothetical protein FRC01_002046 [Tulasnella sp. 417]